MLSRLPGDDFHTSHFNIPPADSFLLLFILVAHGPVICGSCQSIIDNDFAFNPL